MNRLVFHKKFVPITKTREVTVNLNSITDLYSYIDNFFPVLSTQLKTHKKVKCIFLIDGKSHIPQSWILQDKILDKNCDIYIVPSIYGGDATMGASIAAGIAKIDFTQLLVQSIVGTAIGVGLSLIIRALMPKPKRANEEAVDRRENDIFGSIVNTVDSGTAIALNYGMVRIGGQIISSDVEVLTDQRGSIQEETTIVDTTGTFNPAGDGGSGSGSGSDFGKDTSLGGNDLNTSDNTSDTVA